MARGRKRRNWGWKRWGLEGEEMGSLNLCVFSVLSCVGGLSFLAGTFFSADSLSINHYIETTATVKGGQY